MGCCLSRRWLCFHCDQDLKSDVSPPLRFSQQDWTLTMMPAIRIDDYIPKVSPVCWHKEQTWS
jgi:hypothetical protein